MEGTIFSLIPPILALVMVMLTRRVLLSLGVGIVVGAFMINYGSGNVFMESIQQIFSIVFGIFFDDGAINSWELYIIFFLLLLGMIASLIAATGGSRAFGEWAMSRVKTRIGAQLVTVLLGIIIFIDDYFNSLTVGNVGRPLTDRHKISRAKLAYLVDSTAAPMCVIAPVSSWGAYIITIIGGILVSHSVTQWEALQAFVLIAPMNFYAIFAVLMVVAVIYFKLDIGQMRIHEQRAIETGEVVDKSKGPVPGDQGDVSTVVGKVGDLIWPIVTLIVATVFFMITTGIQGTDGDATILAIFENTDVAAALLYGGLVSLAVTLVLSFSRKLGVNEIGLGLWAGIKSMLPAIYILIFAWTIISIIKGIGTGDYLAGLVQDANLNLAFLPVILFVIAGFMAFSTGTSWGTFGIMLPIAGDIAAATDVSMMLPVLAAVLAGSIFGDHCSPISDTTILSSTGAGSHHMDHVLTQLPYALIIAGISIVGYLVLGFTGSAFVGFLAATAAFVVVIIVLKKLFPALKGA
ncbi:Na+/H+ antiporter NhaC family protein [Anaerobacillus isosaccharinicus]|uniref:Na+/H+ antiporter NhaC family protein n=1 Tax=Anaerobacillus isosaccharinicus TaxID=1532552 RepID=A0A1S2MD96_9BACI|nr:Na+/H+ antiporter NhaC family protein [Anaerobacillus isosaccharinicus]MBA5588569.1 Na+/H+ antiporter NhaC family protein [Anaerobacillus isosaccharinicus]QOY38016.1 Na+/H+ antiporter NhaC family protein [Anaerobacillus isosaccharinicus]